MDGKYGKGMVFQVVLERVGNIDSSTRGVECLTPKQTKYIYKKVELGRLINKETLKEEIDLDAELE